ncbi:MAG TPA: AsmA family protein [Albitalea sp.]
MPSWLRRVLIALAVVLFLLVAGAVWFIATFDANRFKGVAIDWMKTERNRTLVIDGPIELTVFPRLAVKVSKLSVSDVGRSTPFAALEEAGLAVDMWPLLRGEVVVGGIDARGVRLTYLRDARGRSNVDDLMQPKEPATPSAAKKPLRLDISRITLKDVRARVKDDVAKVDGELTLRSFTAGRIANQVEAPVELDAQFDFKQPLLKGSLSGDTRLTLDTDSGSLALRDMSLAFKGDAPGVAGVDATLKGAVAWDGAKKSADAQALAVQLSGHTGTLKHAGSTLAIERFSFDPARKTLALRRLQARVKGTQANLPVTLDLDWPELSVSGDTLSGSAFSGALTRGGEMPIAARFKSNPPSGNFDAVRLPGFEAQLTSEAPRRKLAGTLRSDLTLQPGKAALVLDRLDLQAKIEEPQVQPLALTLRGNAVASGQRSSWVLAGQLNENRFSSDGQVLLNGGVPQVTAKARFDSLDLNRLTGPAAPDAKTPPAAGGDTPVDLAALRSVNGRFSVQAARFAFRQYRVADARIEAALDAGMLRITELRGQAWGGQLNATAFADARASRIAIKGAANGVNVNALVKDVAAKDWIEGTGRVAWDIDTAGRSVNEMKSRLQGNAALQLRDGAIKGINLAKTLRQAKAALSMKQDASQKSVQTEKTDFSELSASFQIADGVARNRDLDMKSPFLRLGGEGAIDVGRGRIDYLARATVTSTSQGQDAADLAALKGLTVPVRLAGPFESLDWKIEWSSVAAGLVTRKLEDKLSEKLGLKPPAQGASQPSPADALKNKLKGLFK